MICEYYNKEVSENEALFNGEMHELCLMKWCEGQAEVPPEESKIAFDEDGLPYWK